MRRAAFLTIAGLVVAGAALHAQRGGRQRPQTDVPPAPRPTFRAATRLVEVTVVVQDSDRRPVPDLARDDFTIYDEGREQQIELFTVQSDAPRPTAAAAAAAASAPAGVFSNHVDPRAAGSVTAILIDRINSRAADQTYARNQLLSFLAQIRPEDRVAIYVLEPDAVHVMHDFTNDSASLVRALGRYRARDTDPTAAESVGPSTGDPEIDAIIDETTKKLESMLVPRRVESTTQALEAIAHHLAGVRGRKNLIWVSSGFPVTAPDGTGGTLTFSRQLNRAVRAVNDGNIAIYPVDDRGLLPPYLRTIQATATRLAGARVPMTSDMSRVSATQDSMRALADDTGGRVFLNTNDIGGAVRRAIDDGRVTYTLGYYPSLDKWDGKFREIKVKVNRPGVIVRHRKGYVAAPIANDPNARQDALLQLARSPLPATGIGLMADLAPNAARAGEVALTLRVDPGTVTLQKSGDNWVGVLDVLIVQSTPDGALFKTFGGAVNLNFADARRAVFMTEGLALTRTIALQPNAVQLRVLVRDAPTGTTGSLIIPVR